jgi:hypothetical protein
MARQISQDNFLYVPDDEIPEALSLGAKMIEGDARLLKPRPIPPKIDPKAFDRWQTDQARYRWCMRFIARIAKDLFSVDDINEMFQTLGKGQLAHERVYLWVPMRDAETVRRIQGVQWDKRRRMYYATQQADLSALFAWLTPMAKATWEAERVTNREIALLVQGCAEEEVKRVAGGGAAISEPTGRVQHKRPPSRTVPE